MAANARGPKREKHTADVIVAAIMVAKMATGGLSKDAPFVRTND